MSNSIFKFWSATQSEALKELHPTLGHRSWDELSIQEKDNVWHYLKNYFSDENLRTFFAIHYLNENHKYRSYGKHFLHEQTEQSARMDFEHIFRNESQNVLLELFSCFCQAILAERADKALYRSSNETDEEFENRLNEYRYKDFDKFAERLNDVFEHYGVNVLLTRQEFIPRQDEKITKEIYIPVLQFLSAEQWAPVNRDLRDAFKAYQEKTDQGYSNSITHAVTALQAFLQIIVDGKSGSSEGIISLVKKAQEKDAIPADKFSSEIFKNLDAVLMRERGKSGDAHPKQEYANEKNARLVLNLVMVFIQHCIQK
ncbi:MAG: hypothetical protein WC648_00735 [Candidatus Paceibacterota bacterium]|jgi:hypothetical protein